MGSFRVGKPRVKLTRSVAWSFTGGNPAVSWDLVAYEDPPGVVSGLPTTGFTVTKTGLWLITTTIQRAPYAPAVQSVLRVRVNGVDRSTMVGGIVPGSLGITNTLLEELVAGDVVAVHYQTGTAAQGATTINPNSFLSLTRVGPDRWT